MIGRSECSQLTMAGHRAIATRVFNPCSVPLVVDSTAPGGCRRLEHLKHLVNVFAKMDPEALSHTHTHTHVHSLSRSSSVARIYLRGCAHSVIRRRHLPYRQVAPPSFVTVFRAAGQNDHPVWTTWYGCRIADVKVDATARKLRS